MRISDWSSDVCSSDLAEDQPHPFVNAPEKQRRQPDTFHAVFLLRRLKDQSSSHAPVSAMAKALQVATRSSGLLTSVRSSRSEEHKSELQSLMRNSYAVFCLKKKIELQPTSQVT